MARTIEPFFVHADGRRIYCALHPAIGEKASDAGVLLCSPFGTEAIRVHRLQRVLADRLSRNGFSVMRFDYYATGESEGSDDQGDLERWRLDVIAADRALRQRAGCVRTLWVGMRLGGSLAALSAGQSDVSPAGLLLWDPIVDGQAYLAEIRRAHSYSVAMSYGDARMAEASDDLLSEASGFSIGIRLRDQLNTLTTDAFRALSTCRVCIVARPGCTKSRALADRLGHHSRVIAFDHSMDWTAEEAVNTALVPAEAIALISAEVQSLR